MQILENVFNKSTVNIMLDIETLGTKPGCKVLSIGLAYFDEGGVFATGELYPSLTSQTGSEERGTLDWWDGQSDAAKVVFTNNILHGKSVADCADALTDFIHKAKVHKSNGNADSIGKVNIWGNGATFDNAILAELFRAHGHRVPWNTFGDRCYRTILNTLPKVEPPHRHGVHHSAVDDAEHQANVLIATLKNASK